MKLKRLTALTVGLVTCFQLSAQFRKYSNEFLNIGAGARGLAMGGAQVASVSDGTAGYWNPAGLVGVKDHPSVNLMHAEYFSGIGKYDYGSLAIPLHDQKRVVSLSVLRFAVDDIPNTLDLIQRDGSINYNNISSFSSADYAFLLSYSQKIKDDDDEKLSFGGNAKIIYRKVGSFASAYGFGIDAGIHYQHNNWQFGLMARDVTTTFNAWSFTFSDREKEQLFLTQNDIPVKSTELTAPRLIAGVAHLFDISDHFKIGAEANFDLTFDGKENTVISSKRINVNPHAGVEVSYANSLFFRAGVANFQRSISDEDSLNLKKTWIFQPSVGVGFKIGNVMIDYAFTNLANQSNPLYTHIFSLKVDLRKKDE